jgi:AcrR family transcriptional regulator
MDTTCTLQGSDLACPTLKQRPHYGTLCPGQGRRTAIPAGDHSSRMAKAIAGAELPGGQHFSLDKGAAPGYKAGHKKRTFILFVPRLKDQSIARNQQRIERAALRVFTRRGYHGTSVRDIADAAGVSIGNLYNYYRTKEQIFSSVVRRYEERIEWLRQQVLGKIDDVFDAEQLAQMAAGIRQIVYENPDYWRLMYIDVIEFGSRHFAHTFRSLARGLRKRMGQRIERYAQRPGWSGIDPALAFTAIYLQLFTYFLVEKLFGGRRHLGMPDRRAVAQLIEMALYGVWRKTSAMESHTARRMQCAGKP